VSGPDGWGTERSTAVPRATAASNAFPQVNGVGDSLAALRYSMFYREFSSGGAHLGHGSGVGSRPRTASRQSGALVPLGGPEFELKASDGQRDVRSDLPVEESEWPISHTSGQRLLDGSRVRVGGLVRPWRLLRGG